MELNQIIYGDNREKLKDYPNNFFDGIVTDPPYGIGFMNKDWDTFNSQIILEAKEKYDKTPSKNLQRTGPDGKIRKINKPISSIATLAGSYDLSIKGQRHFQQWFYEIAVEMLRVVKPGSFLLCFGGTRTEHRVVCAIEDAGWIIKDKMMWLYGQGFPKSTDISKQIDKEAGKIIENRSEFTEFSKTTDTTKHIQRYKKCKDCGKLLFGTDPCKCEWRNYRGQTDLAKQWKGYGTGLKPGWESIIIAMKPLEKGLTYAQNAKKWGVAGLNIDGGRIGIGGDYTVHNAGCSGSKTLAWNNGNQKESGKEYKTTQGRWPANVILTHSPNCIRIGIKEIGKGETKTAITKNAKSSWKNSSKNIDRIIYGKETVEIWACVPDCPIRILDDQSGILYSGDIKSYHKKPKIYGRNSYFESKTILSSTHQSDSGGASRFFYCAKASKAEKEEGLKNFIECIKCENFNSNYHTETINGKKIKMKCIRNNHPTVKPLDLMRYLCTLLKMPNKNQVILDPFCGTGTTLIACKELDINYIGIEQDMDSYLIAITRIGD